MTPRERVIAAVEFRGPDRVPLCHCALPAAFAAHPWLPDLLRRYPSDFAGQFPDPPTELPLAYRVGSWTDAWGCEWTVAREGQLGQATGHPLADLSALDTFRAPAPEAETPGLYAPRPRADDRYVMRGSLSLFERMIFLCGFDNLLLALAAGDERLLRLRDLIVEHNLATIRGLFAWDLDCVTFSDDWGSQLALLISPALWREVFLPAYRQMFAPVREAGRHVWFNTDGATLEILPDLVEAGVKFFWADLTLNPLPALREKLGGQVCFQALTDVQFVLPHGTPEEVYRHGREIVEELGRFGGGVIACSEVAPDQPRENVEAIFAAFAAGGGA